MTTCTSGAILNWNVGGVVTQLPTIFNNSGQLQAIIPPALIAAAGTVQLSITENGVNTGTAPFTISLPPIIGTVTSPSAIVGTPIVLTITPGAGGSFDANATVNWFPPGDSSPIVLTPTLSGLNLVVTIPVGDIPSAGTYSVSVNDGGVTSSSVSFNVAPSVTSLNPVSVLAGSLTSPLVLTINGSGFTAGSTVNFGTTLGLIPTNITASSITVPIPVSLLALSANIQVTVTNGGTSAPLAFTISPNVTAIATVPTPVLASTSSVLTVTGLGFSPSATVQVNNTSLSLTTTLPTSLVGTIPVALIPNAGTYSVTVTDGGVISSPLLLNVLHNVTSISPLIGVTGGTALALTVSGLGFSPSAQVFATLGGTSTQLTLTSGQTNTATNLYVTMPASLLNVAPLTNYTLTVKDGGQTSNSFIFGVVAAPTLTSVVNAATGISSVAAGATSLTLTLTGTGFYQVC